VFVCVLLILRVHVCKCRGVSVRWHQLAFCFACTSCCLCLAITTYLITVYSTPPHSTHPYYTSLPTPTPHSPLPTPIFPTPHYPLPISNSPLPTTHSQFFHNPLPISHSPLPTTHFPLPTTHYPFSLPTTQRVMLDHFLFCGMGEEELAVIVGRMKRCGVCACRADRDKKRALVCACVCACVRACVRACVCVRTRVRVVSTHYCCNGMYNNYVQAGFQEW
jgi:hypothetical protein